MNTTKFIYVPEARVQFSKEEVEALFWASEHHYDGLCKRQSEPGGLLWGMRNRAEFPPIDMCLGSGDVDLLCKIAEGLEYKRVGSRIDPIAAQISMDLGRLLASLKAEYTRLNP